MTRFITGILVWQELCYGDLDLYDEDDMDKEDEELFFTNDDLHEPGSPVSLQDPVISAEDVISEIEAMMEVGKFAEIAGSHRLIYFQ